jgi:hypothetical protein
MALDDRLDCCTLAMYVGEEKGKGTEVSLMPRVCIGLPVADNGEDV